MKLSQMKTYSNAKDFSFSKYNIEKNKDETNEKNKIRIATTHNSKEGDVIKIKRQNIFTSNKFEHYEVLKEIISEFSTNEDFKNIFKSIEFNKKKIKAEDFLLLNSNDIKRIIEDTNEDNGKQIYNGSISIIFELNEKNEQLENLVKLFLSPNALNIAALLLKVREHEKYNFNLKEKNHKIRENYLASNTISKLCNLSSRGTFDNLKFLDTLNIINLSYGDNQGKKINKQATLNKDLLNITEKERNPLLPEELSEDKKQANNETLQNKIQNNSFFIFRN